MAYFAIAIFCLIGYVLFDWIKNMYSQCPNCGTRKGIEKNEEVFSDSSTMTQVARRNKLYLKCTKCGKKWTDYEDEGRAAGTKAKIFGIRFK